MTLEQLKEKYGPNWGLTPEMAKKGTAFKAQGWDEITAAYSADPSRLERLLNTDSAFARREMNKSA